MATLFDALDDSPPRQSHSPTSCAAAEAVKPDAKRMRQMVYDAIKSAGDDGLTDEEMFAVVGLRHNSARPRRIDLMHDGLVRDSGRKRAGSSGHPATVWVYVCPAT
jgi:hypothetical protein